MKRRKFISLLTCLCLLFSLAPAAAFAAEAAAPQKAIATEAGQQQGAPVSPQAVSGPGLNSQETDPAKSTSTTNSDPAKSPAESTTLATGQGTTETVQGTQPSQGPADASGTTDNALETTDTTGSTDATEPLDAQQPTSSKAPDANSQETQNATGETVPAAEPSESDSQQQTEPAQSDTEKPAAAPSKAAKKKAAATTTTATVEKTVNGIKVSGGVEGKDWTYDPENQLLTITKDGMTVSGTATDDLIILCTLAVSALTVDSLQQGKNTIVMLSMDDSDSLEDFSLTNLTINIKGKNEIAAIIAAGDLTFTGKKNSSLTMDVGVTAAQDLTIKNATVTGGIFSAGRDLNITGRSVVTAKSNQLLDMVLDLGISPAMMMAGRDLNIDLSSGGSVRAEGYVPKDKDALFTEVYPMMALRNINISKGSSVITPQGGKVGKDLIWGLIPVSVITDQYGVPALNTTIKHGTAGAAYQGTVSAAAVSSPQTGDHTHVLAFVYIMLAAAGAAAFISRRRNKI